MPWIVAEDKATLSLASWLFSYSLKHPEAGLTVTAPDGSELGMVAQIQPIPARPRLLDDHFVRNTDLMVRYGQSSEDRFGFQVDLRAVPSTDLAGFNCGLDLWLSVQTQLLDSHPVLMLTSSIAKSSGWNASEGDSHSGEPGRLAWLTTKTSSGDIVLMVHPSDQEQTELVPDQAGSTSQLRLFGNFMEKGVIRRGRLRILFSKAAVSDGLITEAYSHFANSPLPLTT